MFTFDTLHKVVCNFNLIDTKLYDAFSVTFIPLQFILSLILRREWLVYVIYIKCQKVDFAVIIIMLLPLYLTRYLKHATNFYMLDIYERLGEMTDLYERRRVTTFLVF